MAGIEPPLAALSSGIAEHSRKALFGCGPRVSALLTDSMLCAPIFISADNGS
jgi:hypothetical protein